MENINIIGLVETAMGALGYRTEIGGINLSRNLDILNPVAIPQRITGHALCAKGNNIDTDT